MSALSPTVEVAPAVSFEAFVAGQQVALRRYALALTRSEADADDLLQTHWSRCIWPGIASKAGPD